MQRHILAGHLILFPLFLTGCGFNDYHSQLAEPIKEPSRFEADMAACRKEANQPPPLSQGLAIGAFGAIGLAAIAADDNRAFKSKPELADECMRAKGYAVAKRS